MTLQELIDALEKRARILGPSSRVHAATDVGCALGLVTGLVTVQLENGEREVVLVVDDTFYDCPGTGRCHGTLKWCVRCDDVRKVCDDPICDVHAGEAARTLDDGPFPEEG